MAKKKRIAVQVTVYEGGKWETKVLEEIDRAEVIAAKLREFFRKLDNDLEIKR